jgi:hypothetical protein
MRNQVGERQRRQQGEHFQDRNTRTLPPLRRTGKASSVAKAQSRFHPTTMPFPLPSTDPTSLSYRAADTARRLLCWLNTRSPAWHRQPLRRLPPAGPLGHHDATLADETTSVASPWSNTYSLTKPLITYRRTPDMSTSDLSEDRSVSTSVWRSSLLSEVALPRHLARIPPTS